MLCLHKVSTCLMSLPTYEHLYLFFTTTKTFPLLLRRRVISIDLTLSTLRLLPGGIFAMAGSPFIFSSQYELVVSLSTVRVDGSLNVVTFVELKLQSVFLVRRIQTSDSRIHRCGEIFPDKRFGGFIARVLIPEFGQFSFWLLFERRFEISSGYAPLSSVEL